VLKSALGPRREGGKIEFGSSLLSLYAAYLERNQERKGHCCMDIEEGGKKRLSFSAPRGEEEKGKGGAECWASGEM